jgi:uncharacterized protein YcbK (DUF882 family)
MKFTLEHQRLLLLALGGSGLIVGIAAVLGYWLWEFNYLVGVDNAEKLPITPWWVGLWQGVISNLVMVLILGIPLWIVTFFIRWHPWKVRAAILISLVSMGVLALTLGRMELESSDSGCVSSPPWAYQLWKAFNTPAEPCVASHRSPVKRTFETWLETSNHQAETAVYANYLQQQGVGDVLPLSELLSAARDWQKCDTAPFILPPKDKWQNMVNTLKLLRILQNNNSLPAFDVISSYRYPVLNTCAGGSQKSKHLSNGALDIRFKSPTVEQQISPKLCEYWRQSGTAQAMGLGFYAGGQIHIDTQGFRTWGQDYTAKSSPCQ